MDEGDFNDAFLDSTYLKLDRGALSFIFTPARVDAALNLSVEQARSLMKKHHAALVKIYGDTTRRILIEAFYMGLFEDLSNEPNEVAFAFINLCMQRIEDPDIEQARVAEVKKYQSRRKSKAGH